MLKAVELSGFRSFGTQPAVMPFSPITVLVGKNGSGKSSLLKALLAIKQTVEASQTTGALLANGPLVELGRFSDYTYAHNRRGQVSIKISFLPRRGFNSRDETGRFSMRRGPCEAQVVLRLAGSSTVAQNFQIQIDDLAIRAERSPRGAYSVCIRPGEETYHRNLPRSWSRTKFHHLASPPSVLTRDINWHRYTSLVPRQLSMAFEEEFRRMAYIGPLREHPHRMYYFPEPASHVGLKGENAVGILAAQEKRLEDRLHHWLDRFGIGSGWSLRRQVGSYYQMYLNDPYSGTPVNLADSAFGASQVLPILVAGFTLPMSGSLLLEQPEIHLHPGAQATLADLFIAVASGPLGRSVVVETHSEHIIARLQRRVAESEIPPEMVQLLYFEPHDGGSTVTPLRLDESGHVRMWPQGLFEDSWSETVALIEATLKSSSRER